jgi:hypothetical protein
MPDCTRIRGVLSGGYKPLCRRLSRRRSRSRYLSITATPANALLCIVPSRIIEIKSIYKRRHGTHRSAALGEMCGSNKSESINRRPAQLAVVGVCSPVRGKRKAVCLTVHRKYDQQMAAIGAVLLTIRERDVGPVRRPCWQGLTMRRRLQADQEKRMSPDAHRRSVASR